MDNYKEKYFKYKKKYTNTKKLQKSQYGGNNNENSKMLSMEEWADFIVVGAGAAGSVLAARLAQKLPNDKILVLELGPDNLNNPLIENPNTSSLLWNNPDGPHPSCLDFKTIPQIERTYTYPRGNGGGGSTNHHTLIDGRGSYKIYDRIAKIVGDVLGHRKKYGGVGLIDWQIGKDGKRSYAFKDLLAPLLIRP